MRRITLGMAGAAALVLSALTPVRSAATTCSDELWAAYNDCLVNSSPYRRWVCDLEFIIAMDLCRREMALQ